MRQSTIRVLAVAGLLAWGVWLGWWAHRESHDHEVPPPTVEHRETTVLLDGEAVTCRIEATVKDGQVGRISLIDCEVPQ